MTKRTGARTGGRFLFDHLRIQGCDRIFTVPGENFLAVPDASSRMSGTIPKRLGL